MFQRSYFEAGFHRQLEQVGANPVVRLSRNCGSEEVWIRSIEQASDGYLTLNVYRPHGTGSYSTRSGEGTHFPPAMRYEAIDSVWISDSTAGDRPKVGFFPQ